MRRLLQPLAALLFVCVACHPRQEPAAVPSSSTARAEAQGATLEASFQRELDRLRAEHDLPGATAAYALPDGTVGVAAAGLADVERRMPMTSHSRMLAASVGKSFVAAMALALALEGTLDLDAPISALLSGRPWLARLPNHDRITTRQLLTHTAGPGDPAPIRDTNVFRPFGNTEDQFIRTDIMCKQSGSICIQNATGFLNNNFRCCKRIEFFRNCTGCRNNFFQQV